MRPLLLVLALSFARFAAGQDAPPPTPPAAPAPVAPPPVTPPTVAPAPPTVAPQDAAPQMESLSVRTAKPGDVIDIVGVGLSDRKIDEVYLTDHKFDMRVKLLEQKDTVIKFRVPPFAKPGRMQILALTKGDDPKLLEQPLYIIIEDPTTQVTQVKPPPPPEVVPTPKPETHETKEAIKQDKN